MPMRSQSEEFLDRNRENEFPNHDKLIPKRRYLFPICGHQYPLSPAKNKLTSIQTVKSSMRSFKSSTDLSISDDIPCLTNKLHSSNATVLAAAAACIQHHVFKNEAAKEEAWRSGAIGHLVRLLASEHTVVVSNSTGALRNITSTSNAQLCLEFVMRNGVQAIVWLIEQSQLALYGDQSLYGEEVNVFIEHIQKSVENATAILCNITAIESVRRQIPIDVVLPPLVCAFLIPASEAEIYSCDSSRENCSPFLSSLIFRNCTAVVRNLSCCMEAEVLGFMRGCDGLLESLLRVLRAAMIAGEVDTKAVENCVCSLRNLSFVFYKGVSESATTNSKPLASRILDKALHSRRGRDETKNIGNAVTMDTHDALLWHPESVKVYLEVLRRAFNPVCIEAAVGAIRNLVVSNRWPPAMIVRSEVRLQHGLPLLVGLLRFTNSSVVAATAMTLHDLADEQETVDELGEHYLSILVSCLTVQPQMSRSRSLSSIASFVSSATINTFRLRHTKSDCQSLLPLLALCAKVVLGQEKFVCRFVEFGGVEQLRNLSRGLWLAEVYEPAEPRCVCGRTAYKFLKALWRIKRFHSLYKEIGLCQCDFLIKRTAKMSQIRPRPVPLSFAKRCTEVEERQRRMYNQARNCGRRERSQGPPSVASSLAHQLSLFSGASRGQSVETPRRTASPYRSLSPFTSGLKSLPRNGSQIPISPSTMNRAYSGNSLDFEADFVGPTLMLGSVSAANLLEASGHIPLLTSPPRSRAPSKAPASCRGRSSNPSM